MRYISTRGAARELGFEEVLFKGLADDGGLYVPKTLPKFSSNEIGEMGGLSYEELVQKIVSPFIGDEIPAKDLQGIIKKSYAAFRHESIAPLKQIGNNEWMLELFWGPTLAFKDFALQMLGNLLDYFLKRRGEKIAIIGATSGDTGSAAIWGCKSCKAAQIFILHPHNMVSDVQRRQMTSILDKNVHNIALRGNFDDCQAMLKSMFGDQGFLKGRNLVAVNSINWARIMSQIVYYFYSACKLGSPQTKVSFSVPTGNFGDIYAGYIAKQMGLPIKKLIVATNDNDILARFFNKNDYSRKRLIETLSPSMNIQVSSNFERLLFDLHERDGKKIADLMENFAKSGGLAVSGGVLKKARESFCAASVSDAKTRKLIGKMYEATGETIDPHTIIGIHAAKQYIANDIGGGKNGSKDDKYSGEPLITLSTAHPAKFPHAIEESGIEVKGLPVYLEDLFSRKEKFDILANDIDIVKNYITQKL